MILYKPQPYGGREVPEAFGGLYEKVLSPALDDLLDSLDLELVVMAKGSKSKTYYQPGCGYRIDSIHVNTNRWPLAVLHEIGHYIVASKEARNDRYFDIELPVVENEFYVSEGSFLEETKARYVDLCLMAFLGIKKRWRKHHLNDIKWSLAPCWDLFQTQILELTKSGISSLPELIGQDHIRQTNHLILHELG